MCHVVLLSQHVRRKGKVSQHAYAMRVAHDLSTLANFLLLRIEHMNELLACSIGH